MLCKIRAFILKNKKIFKKNKWFKLKNLNLLINSSKYVAISYSNFIKADPNIININITSSSPNISVNSCKFSDDNPINIISEDLVKIEKNASYFEAKFLQIFSPLSNRQIIFKINGVEYKRTTDSEGVARMAINLVPGNYTVESIYPVTGASKNNTITVLPRIVENYDLEKYYKNNSQYIIKVLDDQRKPRKSKRNSNLQHQRSTLQQNNKQNRICKT